MNGLNALIAQGGRGQPSIVQRYQQAKKDQQAQQMNALSMQSTQQQMGIRQQESQQAQQTHDMKRAAPLAKAVLESDNPETAYIQSKNQMQTWGMDTSDMPEVYTPDMNSTLTAVMQAGGLSLDVVKGKRRNALYRGEVVPAIEDERGYLTSPATGERMPGATIAPSRQTSGEPGAYGGGYRKDTAKDKDMKIAIESEEGLRNLGANVNRIKDTLNASTDYIGGLTGTFVGMINSGQMQFDQILGRRDPLADAQGKIDSKQLGNLSKENIGWVRKAAIEGKRVDSAILELAFTHAKILNNSGKISDADIKYARDIIEGGADKATKIDSLNNLLERGYSNYSKQRKTREGRGKLQEHWKDIGRDEIFGKGFQPVGQVSAQDQSDADAAATEALKAMGL